MNDRGAAKLSQGQTVKGMIPAVDIDMDTWTAKPTKLIPWQKATYVGKDNRPNPEVWDNVEVPQHVFEKMQAEFPAPVRRTARQRNEALIRRLLDIGKANTVNGQILWPDSLKRILDLRGVKVDGDLNRQVFALARYFSLKAENKQRETDARQTTVGWHGHFD